MYVGTPTICCHRLVPYKDFLTNPLLTVPTSSVTNRLILSRLLGVAPTEATWHPIGGVLAPQLFGIPKFLHTRARSMEDAETSETCGAIPCKL